MKTKKILGAALAGALVVAGTSVALANDNLIADGDGLTPVNNNDLALGEVCPGETVPSSGTNVALAIHQQNHNGHNQFDDEADVEITVALITQSAAGTGVAGTLSAPEEVGTITMPEDWNDRESPPDFVAATSDVITATVTLTVPSGAEDGTYAGTVRYSAAGDKYGGGSHTETRNMQVSWTVLEADDPECGSATYTLDGFYAPVKFADQITIRGGSTVPLKFNLFDGETRIENEADKIDLTFEDCTVNGATVNAEEVAPTTVAASREVRWDDSDGGHYIFNYKTPKNLGCKSVTVEHDDADVDQAGLEVIGK